MILPNNRMLIVSLRLPPFSACPRSVRRSLVSPQACLRASPARPQRAHRRTWSSWGWSGERLDPAKEYDNRLNVMRDLLAFGDI